MLELLQLSVLGAAHTLISLVAMAAGIVALARYRIITAVNALGQIYIVATILTCVTGFFIFRHGGFGKPHALGVITLLVIAVAIAAARTKLFGAAARKVEVAAYSTTLFFHTVPAVTETATRLPIGAPLITDRESPVLQAIAGVFLLVLVAGVVWQVRWLAKKTTP